MKQPTLQTLPTLLLVGLKADASHEENRTQALWQRFGPLREKIEPKANTNLYSVEVIPTPLF